MLTLIGPSPASLRGGDPVEDLRHRELDAVHRREHLVVERVEAHRHALQARLRQRPGELAAAPSRSS